MWRSILCLIVLVVSGCSTNNTPDTTTSADEPPIGSSAPVTLSDEEQALFPTDWEPPQLDWQPCQHRRSLECSELHVPTDWDNLDSPTVRLQLAKAATQGDRLGTIILNPGGPGGSGVEYLSPGTLSAELMQRFDVVSWDPRGVGESTTLDCNPSLGDFFAFDADPDTPIEQETLERAAQDIADDCAPPTNTGTELIHFLQTKDTVMDLEAIRRSLGNEPLNFLGYSYGSHIGLRYVERFPSAVRTLVLDGVVDPAEPFETFLTNQAVSFEQTFQAQRRACAAAGPKECGVGELDQAFSEVLDQTESGVRNEDGELISPTVPIMAAVSSGYHETGWQALSESLEEALDGDWFGLELLADLYYSGVDYAAYLSVVCTDSPRPTSAGEFRDFADRLRDLSPQFGATVANELLPCAWWHAPPGPAPEPVRFPPRVPLLFVGSTDDPATPYHVAKRLAQEAPVSQLITAHRFGHTSYGRDVCVTDHVDDYFLTAVLPTADPHCGR